MEAQPDDAAFWSGEQLTLEADQWSEQGYLHHAGFVRSYWIDRKEGQDGLGAARPIDAWLSDANVSDAVKDWLRSIAG